MRSYLIDVKRTMAMVRIVPSFDVAEYDLLRLLMRAEDVAVPKAASRVCQIDQFQNLSIAVSIIDCALCPRQRDASDTMHNTVFGTNWKISPIASASDDEGLGILALDVLNAHWKVARTRTKWYQYLPPCRSCLGARDDTEL